MPRGSWKRPLPTPCAGTWRTDAPTASRNCSGVRWGCPGRRGDPHPCLRVPPPPAGEVDRLLASVDAERALTELTALPGVELLKLVAVAPDLGVSGHVFWHPAHPDVVVCAFHLPSLADGALYRVRLVLHDGETEEAVAFRPAAAGDVVLPVRLRAGADELRAVELVRDPDAAPVLTGQVALPAK